MILNLIAPMPRLIELENFMVTINPSPFLSNSSQVGALASGCGGGNSRSVLRDDRAWFRKPQKEEVVRLATSGLTPSRQGLGECAADKLQLRKRKVTSIV